MPKQLKKKSNRPATLADVGREAGVSAMAVSSVLNGARTSSRTAPETRKRILEAAARLHYRPNAAARALAERRMNTIGVAAVFEGNELNQYFLEVFNGILQAAANHNQNTTVLTLHDWHRDPQRLTSFCDGRVDGLVLVAPRLTREHNLALPEHTPAVSLHANMLLPRLVNLESDEEEGVRTVVAELIRMGHQRIMHLTGPKGLIGAERRIRGYRQALTDANVKREANYLVEAGYTTEEGYRAFKQWLKNSAGELMPQAIFCANDGVAIGCMEALAELGLRVPRDVSVVGFDDTLAARSTVPQLTTVRQPLREMGTKAVDVLMERIQSVHDGSLDRGSKNIVFPTELVMRDSLSGPPGADLLVPKT
jgi:LacI family transcriptional regulator